MSAMRPVFFAALAALVLLTCGALDRFDVAQSAQSTIPKATPLQQLLGGLAFTGFDKMDLAQSAEFKNQGVTKNQVKSVKLSKLTLLVKDPPSGQDFQFLHSIKFYVQADGQPKQLIADGANFAANALLVGLNVYDIELVSYVTAPSLTITTEVNGSAPAQDTTVEATVILTVQADIKGALCG